MAEVAVSVTAPACKRLLAMRLPLVQDMMIIVNVVCFLNENKMRAIGGFFFWFVMHRASFFADTSIQNRMRSRNENEDSAFQFVET